MEIRDKKGIENVVADHLSRINDGKAEEMPINDYFPYDKLVAFVRDATPCYAHLGDFLEDDKSNIKKGTIRGIIYS